MKTSMTQLGPVPKRYSMLQCLQASACGVCRYIPIMRFMGLLWRIFMGTTFQSYGRSNRRWTRTMLWRSQVVGNSKTCSSFSIRFVCHWTPSWHCVEVLTLYISPNSFNMILCWGVKPFKNFTKKIKKEDCVIYFKSTIESLFRCLQLRRDGRLSLQLGSNWITECILRNIVLLKPTSFFLIPIVSGIHEKSGTTNSIQERQ